MKVRNRTKVARVVTSTSLSFNPTELAMLRVLAMTARPRMKNLAIHQNKTLVNVDVLGFNAVTLTSMANTLLEKTRP